MTPDPDLTHVTASNAPDTPDASVSTTSAATSEPLRRADSTGRQSRAAWTYRPAVDIHETSDAIVLDVDLPGADPERIDITLEAGILSLQAEVPDRHHDRPNARIQEFGLGDFHRRFEVDAQRLDVDAMVAGYRDGVLTVTLPKAAAVRRRRIPVTH